MYIFKMTDEHPESKHEIGEYTNVGIIEKIFNRFSLDHTLSVLQSLAAHSVVPEFHFLTMSVIGNVWSEFMKRMRNRFIDAIKGSIHSPIVLSKLLETDHDLTEYEKCEIMKFVLISESENKKLILDRYKFDIELFLSHAEHLTWENFPFYKEYYLLSPEIISSNDHLILLIIKNSAQENKLSIVSTLLNSLKADKLRREILSLTSQFENMQIFYTLDKLKNNLSEVIEFQKKCMIQFKETNRPKDDINMAVKVFLLLNELNECMPQETRRITDTIGPGTPARVPCL